ncbi:hypothetical protein ABZX75_11905 [Streptomyces sp. NPDC003038]|uniref:hypothetical protein n=1 Tax=unclassified Streptomyces TaxID=2593676 RepID=UPI0033B5311E
MHPTHPTHPVAEVRVFSHSAGLIDGVPVTAPPFVDIQEVVIAILQQRAQQMGGPASATISDDRFGGAIRLLIHPDGTTESAE